MKLILKHADEFPNWHLAVEFLRRSQFHFIMSDRSPEIEIRGSKRTQVVLRGVFEIGFVCVPKNFTANHVKAICQALLHENAKEPQPYLGSVHSSNFMTFLQEFTHMLKGKVELAEVAQAITNKTCELFHAEGASILVPTADGERFRFAYHKTQDVEVGRKLDRIEAPGDQGVAGWVKANREPILVNAETKHLIFTQIDKEINFQTEEIIAAPIQIGDNLIGILEVLNRKEGHFEQYDLQTLELIAAIIAVFIDKANLYESRLQYVKINREFEIAHDLQTRLMPSLPTRIGPFRLDGESRQQTRVGGDFWDIFEFSANEKLLIIGDVSGHGLSAALMMSAVRTVSRALLHQVRTPYALVEPLNHLVHQEFSDSGHYVTLILCHVVMDERRVHFFRAGHEKPVLYQNGEFIRLDQQGGLPIGLLPTRRHDPWHEFRLGPDDKLYLYTDGVIDGLDLDEEKTLDQLFVENPELPDQLKRGFFFDRLEEKLEWKNTDDATCLTLCLDTPGS